jgi:YD repeat-containing protein
MGNRTLEQVRDPSSTLAQTRSRVYSSLNRLFQELGATSQTTEYTYDSQGNVLTVKDPLNRITTNQYDALHLESENSSRFIRRKSGRRRIPIASLPTKAYSRRRQPGPIR